MISEKGNLRETYFGKLLVNLYEKKVTGILYLRVGGVLKELYVNHGKLIWAVSTADDEKLDAILLQKIDVDMERVDQLKKEHHLSSTVSFFLQEKGIVTSEQVVDSFRIQIQRIFAHILKLHEGEYNFVYGLSPKKAIDLEMEIPECLRAAIQTELSPEVLWKFMGSFKTELKRSEITLSEEPDSLASLKPDELELLPSLEQWTSIEAMLSQQSGKDPDTLLRTAYMMVQCGWLDKNEVAGEPPPASMDQTAPSPPEPPPLAAEKFAYSGQMASLPEVDSIDLDLPSKEDHLDLSPSPRPRSSSGAKPSRKRDLDRSFPVNLPSSSKPRTSLVKVIVIPAILLVIGGGAYYLYKSGILFPAREEPAELTAPIRKKPPRVVETKPEATTPDASGTPGTEVSPPPKETANAAQGKTGTEEKEPSAEELFSQGKYKEAGDAWRMRLLREGMLYGVLLELDCARESVQAAIEQIPDKSEFYILNRVKNERLCYLVMLGKFQTQEEAQLALKGIPSYFWNQPSPPTVVELAPYLESR